MHLQLLSSVLYSFSFFAVTALTLLSIFDSCAGRFCLSYALIIPKFSMVVNSTPVLYDYPGTSDGLQIKTVAPVDTSKS